MDRYNDPNVIGPGVWFSIHLLCEKAARTEDIDDYAMANNLVTMVIDNFPSFDEEVGKFIDTFQRFKTGKELSVWVYKLHAITNPKEPVSHEELTSYFDSLDSHSHGHGHGDDKEEECDECSKTTMTELMAKYSK